MKVIFLSLPIPLFYQKIQRGNHQLLAEYMRALFSQCSAREQSVEIVPVPRSIIDGCNNRAITNWIKQIKPDLVCFSHSVWNIERHLDIAARLKGSGIYLAGGGCEVYADNEYLMQQQSLFNLLVQGEGEIFLTDFLLNFKHYQSKPALRWMQTDQLMDINQLIEPYIDITDQYQSDGLFYFEIERGCAFNCLFCAYSKSRSLPGAVNSLLPDVFERGLKKIFQKEIRELYLLAPTLNRDRARFRFFLEKISRYQRMREQPLQLFGEVRAELLNRSDLILMKKAGFKEIEFGVQSMNPAVLARAKRGAGQRDWMELSRQMLDLGLKPMIDFILGLPGESSRDIYQTIELLDKNQLLDYAQFYHLQVLPNSGLKKICAQKSFSYQKEPPYFILQTDQLTEPEIKTVFHYLEEEKGISYYEDFFPENPGQFYWVKQKKDWQPLKETPYYHSCCCLDYEQVPGRDLISFYQHFFEENREIFHTLYLYSRQLIKIDLLDQLKAVFQAYPNYYDHYRRDIAFYPGEVFSKKIVMLLEPAVSQTYLTELFLHRQIEVGFYLPSEAECKQWSIFLKQAFSEYHIYTYLPGPADFSQRPGPGFCRILPGCF